jgi:hypothetical protein
MTAVGFGKAGKLIESHAQIWWNYAGHGFFGGRHIKKDRIKTLFSPYVSQFVFFAILPVLIS